MGHVDPLKEVNAAAARIKNNITTEEQEASEYNGNDWATNIRQRRREIEALKDLTGNDDKEGQKPDSISETGEEEDDDA